MVFFGRWRSGENVEDKTRTSTTTTQSNDFEREGLEGAGKGGLNKVESVSFKAGAYDEVNAMMTRDNLKRSKLAAARGALSIQRELSTRVESFEIVANEDPEAAEEETEVKNSLIKQGVTQNDMETKVCVLLLCILTATLIVGFTFVYTTRLNDAEGPGAATSSVKLEHMQSKLHQSWENLQEVVQGESLDLTALSSAAQANWPFWTVKDWERRGAHVRHLAPYLSRIGWAPLVQPDQLGAWEAYSMYLGKQTFLRDEGQGDFGAAPLAPIWQVHPDSLEGYDSLLNYNLLSDSPWGSSIADLVQEWDTPASQNDTHIPIYGNTPFSILPNWIPNDDLVLQELTYKKGPYSLLVQPVFDSDQMETRQVVALLFGVFSWMEFLDATLWGLVSDEDASEPQLALLSNSCGERQFYYSSSQREMEEIEFRLQPPTDYTTLRSVLNNDTRSLCHYYVELWRESSFLDLSANHPTKLSPAYFTLIVATVWFVMGCFLLCFFRSREKHYNETQKLATRSSGVLLSMFPRRVCERILDEAAQLEKKEKDVLKGEGKRLKATKENRLDGDAACRRHACSCGPKSRPSKDVGGTPNKKQESSSLLDDASTFDPGADEVDEHNLDDSMAYNTMIQESLQQNRFKSKPIADLFPETTVLFSDIVGFTAWSSSHSPTHVFDLLETIYHTFDQIARYRKVFKVETIGDCYVAVTGIPTPIADHAVVMTRFARDCLHAMGMVTANLEAILGPDTGDLSMRFGLHSGPVTAGVLRGERSRFQLFGDTVNTAARMESTGKAGRIHISQDTANYLARDKKSHWFFHREDKVHAQGKGELQTYWIDPSAIDAHIETLSDDQKPGARLIHPTLLQASSIVEARKTGRDLTTDLIPEKTQRLIDWQVETLYQLLMQIEARRKQLKKAGHNPESVIPQAAVAQSEVTVFDEVKEVIEMPAVPPLGTPNLNAVKMDANVLWQLNDYVTSVSTFYKDNPFHNFEHASHVCLSVTKMLRRIVKDPRRDELRDSLQGGDVLRPIEELEDESDGSDSENAPDCHSQDYSFGISSDPITQFAVVFAALIHDVDHLGVSNAQLLKENNRLARIYKNQSVAEQNSLNLAWDLLMDPSFADLRNCIYATEAEYVRFRAMVINAVMATDIVDADLKKLRNSRWDKAFAKEGGDMTKEDKDRKTTIIVEHLIQASDIAHTMQHWQVYKKWNFLLFQEMYFAYRLGRMEKNPLSFWYTGEIGFFDFYIIPLAKKLKDCGVFGVSCDEYLNYAMNNRAEWEAQGREIVEEYRVWAEERDHSSSLVCSS